MKGILLKDIYNLHGQLKIYLIFPFLGALLTYMQHTITMVIFLLGILIVTILMSAFAYDDMADFSTYALTMPITRKDLALSKYVVSLITTITCGIVSMLIVSILFQVLGTAFFDGVTLADAFLYTILYMFAMNAVNCIMIPLNFKYGTEKGRMFFFLFFFGISGGAYAVTYVFSLIEPSLLLSLSSFMSQYGIYLAVLALMVLEVVSLQISNRILMKKEF